MDAKKKALETIHAYQQTLIDLSHRIHSHPELGQLQGASSILSSQQVRQSLLNLGVLVLTLILRACLY